MYRFLYRGVPCLLSCKIRAYHASCKIEPRSEMYPVVLRGKQGQAIER